MANYSRVLLSGSVNGKPIKIAGTTIGAATTIHTAIAGTAAFDEVYAWFVNTDVSNDHVITIAWGGTTDPDHVVQRTINLPKGTAAQVLLTGQVLQNGLVVSAFSDTTNVVNCFGYVNRIQ